MFRQEFKNNLKNKIMRNKQNISNIFNFIEIVIDLDNKLYERTIKNNLINFIKK